MDAEARAPWEAAAAARKAAAPPTLPRVLSTQPRPPRRRPRPRRRPPRRSRAWPPGSAPATPLHALWLRLPPVVVTPGPSVGMPPMGVIEPAALAAAAAQLADSRVAPPSRQPESPNPDRRWTKNLGRHRGTRGLFFFSPIAWHHCARADARATVNTWVEFEGIHMHLRAPQLILAQRARVRAREVELVSWLVYAVRFKNNIRTC